MKLNPSKNWSIISNNTKKSGIFYFNNDNSFHFKNNIDFSNLYVNSLVIDNNKRNKKFYIDIGKKFQLDTNYNLNLKGNLNLEGTLNSNDTIILNDNGVLYVKNDIIIDDISFKEYFEFTVGLNLNFKNIQECINYIEFNELYKNYPIFIEVYPNKTYKENILISKPNINIIGKYSRVNIIGSLCVDLKNYNDEDFFSNEIM